MVEFFLLRICRKRTEGRQLSATCGISKILSARTPDQCASPVCPQKFLGKEGSLIERACSSLMHLAVEIMTRRAALRVSHFNNISSEPKRLIHPCKTTNRSHLGRTLKGTSLIMDNPLNNLLTSNSVARGLLQKQRQGCHLYFECTNG